MAGDMFRHTYHSCEYTLGYNLVFRRRRKGRCMKKTKCIICGLKYEGSIANCPTCEKPKPGETTLTYPVRQLSESIVKLIDLKR